MADKDFRKLKRWELIEIIEGLQKDLQETTEENDGNKDKKIELDAALQCIQEETSFQCDWNTACGGSNFSIDCNKISTGIAGFGQEHGTGIREW